MADPKSGKIVLVTRDEAHAHMMELAGKIAPNKAHLYCVQCGWEGTLSFTPEEIEAIDGDPENYPGPCPGYTRGTNNEFVFVGGSVPRTEQEFAQEFGQAVLSEYVKKRGPIPAEGTTDAPEPCGSLTLQPKRLMENGAQSIDAMVADKRRRELREQGEIMGEVIADKVVHGAVEFFVGGSLAAAESDNQQKG